MAALDPPCRCEGSRNQRASAGSARRARSAANRSKAPLRCEQPPRPSVARPQRPPEFSECLRKFAALPRERIARIRVPGSRWRTRGGGHPVNKPDYYRQYALECLRLANDTNEPSTKAVLIDMAQAWIHQRTQHQGRAHRHGPGLDQAGREKPPTQSRLRAAVSPGSAGGIVATALVPRLRSPAGIQSGRGSFESRPNADAAAYRIPPRIAAPASAIVPPPA